jgi:hypothetical protein
MSSATKRGSASVFSPAACLIALCIAGFGIAGRSANPQTPAPPAARNPARTAPKTPTAPSASVSYDQMVERAKALISVRPQEAVQVSSRAIKQDPSRYEAHVIAAAALRQQKLYGQATIHLLIAMALAPDDQTPSIRRALAETKVSALPADSRRRLDSLMLILEDAQGARSPGDREPFLREFLTKSAPFLQEYPLVSDLWLLRAQIAVELNEPRLGWQAGQKLMEFGDDRSEDPNTRKLMAMLERKGWLAKKPPDVIPALIAAFNDKIQGIGVQKFHGVDRFDQEFDTTDSLDELRGNCKTGLETRESLLSVQKAGKKYILDPNLYVSKFEDQPLTLLVGNDQFNAVVGQFESSDIERLGYTGSLAVGPAYVHDGKVHSVFRQQDEPTTTTDDRRKDGLWHRGSDFTLFRSNSKSDLQFLADTLMKIHSACLDNR